MAIFLRPHVKFDNAWVPDGRNTIMPIPDLPDFHEILSRIRLSPTKASDQEASIQIPFMPAVDVSGPVSQEAPLWLHYPKATKVTFERLIQRVNKELSASRHATTAVLQSTVVQDRFAIFVLALAALTPSHRGDIASRLNTILTRCAMQT